MHSDEERISRIRHTLSHRRKTPSKISQSMMQLPARFTADDDDDDSHVDASAPSKNTPSNMNQSFFQMMTGASGNARMTSRFDDTSDESDDEVSELPSLQAERKNKGKAPARHNSAHISASKRQLDAIREAHNHPERGNDREGGAGDAASRQDTSQHFQAQAELNTAKMGTLALEKEAEMFGEDDSSDKTDRAPELAKRLVEIFNLPATEEVVSEYPCWLLKSVLLQGYMYITTRHICFYAYLPRSKDSVKLKTGYLAKRGKSGVKYNRYWFIMKGDVLSYYTDSENLYFPNGNIDLRYALLATVEGKDKHNSTYFSLTTDQRKYHFRADSAASAREWVKSLQKVMFSAHNEGDSVKISIPVENVIEVEESPVLEFAETFKLKVIDNDETYAIDEYFFSFFSFAKDALNALRAVVEDSPASKIPEHVLAHSVSSSPQSLTSQENPTTPILRENVRATLAAFSPPASGRASPRASAEYSRSSFDLGRRSADINRETLKRSVEPVRHSMDVSRMSARDFTQSTDLSFGESSDAVRVSSDDELGTSASNILDRSDVFQSPTMKTFRRSRKKETNRKDSSGSRKSMGAEIRIHPPSRSHSGHSGIGSSKKKAGPKSDSDDEHSGKASPRLQDIAKAGVFPLQRAAGWAAWMKVRSKKMSNNLSNLLAADSMGYLEKVSDMWSGGKRHYREPMGMMPNEEVEDAEDEDDAHEHGARFRARFALPPQERLIAVYFGYLHRVLPLYGKIYLSNRSFCFRSILPGTKTKMILPLHDIENVTKEKGFRFGYSGLVVTIRGHEELFFEFGQLDTRDDIAITLLQNIDDYNHLKESGMLTKVQKEDADMAKLEYKMLQDARQVGHNEHDTQLPTSTDTSAACADAPPIVFDDPHGSIISFKPSEPLKITCLTIGTRGDVQPFIALCKGLMKDGHRTKIATHTEYGDWIKSYGIEFAPIEGDPGELMALCVEYGVFTVEFMKQTTSKMRGWLDGLLETAWVACQGSDLLLESPSAMAGIHIAEALKIPYFRCFTMPWTRTRAYPHAFAVPEHKMGGAYNYFTYVIIDNVFWKSTAGQINKWRKNTLNLPSTSLDKLQPNKVPFLYNFSPSVVAPPVDYSDWIRVTGYWFLDQQTDWKPPQELVDFIKKARDDGKKLVYVGFGSVTVADPEAMTRTVVESVQKADVRCILSKGWSDRISRKDSTEPELPLPSAIHPIKSAPHDWLFAQIDAAVHHGGAGTTGASLRAGIPTIIKPFFGDQYFYGNRVEDLGVGICIKKLNVSVFSRALWEATHNEKMMVKAEVLGEQIRSENGTDTAIQAIYRDLEYARTLIKKPNLEPQEESEESWTFVGDDSEAEQARRIKAPK